jgi:peptidoglycan/LPS O-acetylase OafA/YrhL
VSGAPGRPGASGAGRIPSLDGVRAVSILLVVVSHLIGTRGFPVTTTPLLDLGDLGVRVFFVLSGFLITGLLLSEWGRTARIDLRAFYVRRTLRIFPAFYAYLAVLALLALAGAVTLRGGDLLRAATYTINYSSTHDWLVGHAWSLAVEEQFYLTWPLLLLWLTPARAPLGALAAIALAPAMRVLLMALPDGTIGLQAFVGASFETMADAIATGALLALVRDRLWTWAPYRRLVGTGWALLLPVVGLTAGSLRWWGPWVSPGVDWVLSGVHAAVGITVLNLCIAMGIDRVVRIHDGPLGRLLNQRQVAFLGTLSYSVYIWQQLFLDRRTDAWHARFPQNTLLVLAAALLSYHLVEQPVLRLRDRFMRPARP